MKKVFTIVSAIFTVIIPVFCKPAISFGGSALYKPDNSNLFDFTNFYDNNSFKPGITFDCSYDNLALTEEIYLYSTEKGNFKISTISSISKRKSLASSLFQDFGICFNLDIENAIEESNTLYFTSNGVNLKNLFDLKFTHLFDIIGMFNFRTSIGIILNKHLTGSFSYTLNLYPYNNILKGYSFIEILSYGRLSASVRFAK